MANAEKLSQQLDPARRILEILRQRIRDGLYPLQSQLPAERALSDELGIGRAYVRKALATLAHEGVLERRQGRGTRVIEAAPPKRTGRVAVFGNRVEDCRSPEGLAIYAGVMERLRRYGFAFDMFPVYFQRADRFTRQWGEHLIAAEDVTERAKEYDGVVFMEASHPKTVASVAELNAKRQPCVVANLETRLDAAATCVDHKEIRRRSVEILAGFGHRRIAYVGKQPNAHFYDQALEGYQAGLREAGLPVDEKLIVLTQNSYSLHAYLGFKRVLKQPDPPTAVVCARDLYARGVCHAMEEFALEPGYDLSLISFDNCSWLCDDPFLTTFEMPCYDFGAVAVDMLAELIENGWRPPALHYLATPLILRRSVGPVPKKRAFSAR